MTRSRANPALFVPRDTETRCGFSLVTVVTKLHSGLRRKGRRRRVRTTGFTDQKEGKKPQGKGNRARGNSRARPGPPHACLLGEGTSHHPHSVPGHRDTGWEVPAPNATGPHHGALAVARIHRGRHRWAPRGCGLPGDAPDSGHQTRLGPQSNPGDSPGDPRP